MHIASFLKSFVGAFLLGMKNASASIKERAITQIHEGIASPSSGVSAYMTDTPAQTENAPAMTAKTIDRILNIME